MIDIIDINRDSPIVYEVAMVKHSFFANQFFILRSVNEEVVIVVNKHKVFVSDLLTQAEMLHINKYYPLMACMEFEVREKIKNLN